MPDASVAAPAGATDAALALARLGSMSGDLRGGAILNPDGVLLAATGDPEVWERAARNLLAAADAAAGQPVSHAHVGTEEGEAYAVRLGGYALVAAADRFSLASLFLADARAVLRELVRALAPEPEPAAGGGGRR